MLKKLLAGLAVCCVLAGQSYAQLPPKREMRAVWIASVGNIDWPSRKGLSSVQQKQELIKLLDDIVRDGMNAVFFQVRPAADALYASSFEPWSEYLSGQQGRPPEPYYDPLQFAIEESHKRGLELHAWFNPYRAVMNTRSNSLSPMHISRTRPQWFLNYGDQKLFDPGLPEVRDYFTQIIRDVVKRYDIDGVHFDDYFYPYRIAGKEFPDNGSYRVYGRNMNKDDWRRWNVDTLMHQVSIAIKAEKSWVKFGISPFGVWRNRDRDPEGSNTRGGMTNYDDLYADILKWSRSGWIDYATPQLYWEFGHRLVGYEVLVNWWANHAYGRHMYPGLAIYKINGSATWKDPNEVLNQIKANRSLSTVQGSVFFRARSFDDNPLGFRDSLRNHYFKHPALLPTMPWLDNKPPEAPYFIDAFERPGGLAIHWSDDDTTGQTKSYVIYRFGEKEVVNLNDPTKIAAIVQQMPDPMWLDTKYVPGTHYVYFVTALDRLHNESLASDALRMQTVNGKTRFIFDP
ncbi:family 10 glycosylhydrolase [Chitinophaga horti]|uniref:Family 10 glycosylhydrolase n=1 Tax=Chitinophaga horti TaxID=2920382 RepID=A0ABY6IZM8_9BACT|nr:family 10 glycosylhydrolase [Chitinophaga horti]UYQ92873.1 family 10 glycosylhydrolase [Chitinophaga horti]